MASTYSIFSTYNHQTILQAFAQFMSARKGVGEVTVGNHVATIRRLWWRIGMLPTPNAIERLIVRMRNSGASYSHIVNTSMALERYMEFLGTPIQLGRPKKPRRLVRGTLTEAEVTLLINAARNLRERAILALLCYSGVRNKELCTLSIGDIDLANQLVMVNDGKGHKDRDCSISGACIELLATYMRERGGGPNDRLFITLRHGTPFHQQDLRKLIRSAAKRAGIKKRVWPHLMRHSLATNMLHRGANLLAIKEQLGHAYVETTMIYIHSIPARMQMEYKMFGPSYL